MPEVAKALGVGVASQLGRQQPAAQHHLIEIADAPRAGADGERPIRPNRRCLCQCLRPRWVVFCRSACRPGCLRIEHSSQASGRNHADFRRQPVEVYYHSVRKRDALPWLGPPNRTRLLGHRIGGS